MASEKSEPIHRPKERIEYLLSGSESDGDEGKDRRVFDRLLVEPGTEVYFPLICKGEVMDISEEGLSIRFKPSEALNLKEGETIQISMPLEKHNFKISSTVRRMESRFGVIVVGLHYDSENIDVEN